MSTIKTNNITNMNGDGPVDAPFGVTIHNSANTGSTAIDGPNVTSSSTLEQISITGIRHQYTGSAAIALEGYKTRGNGTTTFSPLLDGDDIVVVRPNTANSSGAFVQSGGLYFEADGNHSDTSRPTRASIQLTPSNTITPITVFRIMSTGEIRSVIQDTTTLTSAYVARAWVNFNGTGTVAIREAGNVSSITDNGVGDYTVNFTTSMPDANYSAVPDALWPGNAGWAYGYLTKTTSSYRLRTIVSGTLTDNSNISVMVIR